MTDLPLYLPGFIAAYSILFVACTSPGPAVAMLMGIASNHGRKSALLVTAGIAVGSSTINILTLLGIGLLLSQAAWAMSLLRIVGAAYLLYLAWGAFKRAAHPPALNATQSKAQPAWRHFVTGYLLQVSNPKAIAFWLAISSVGAVEGAPMGVIAAYVLGGVFISFVCHAAWALALSAAKFQQAYTAARRWVEGALGAFFSFAAWKVATAE